jgi:hypothetical protein
MQFMLGPAATLQIHFIDSIATAAVESGACRLTPEPSNTTVMDIGNAADFRNDQP